MAKEVTKKTTVTTVTKKSKKKASPKKKTTHKRKTTRKRSPSKSRSTSSLNAKVHEKLIDNFVAIQKIMTNLSMKFDSLSDRMDKLLDVFEISAKSLAEKDFKDFVKVNDEEIIHKLDDLLEQNKVIAKGLIMLHEKTSPQPQYESSMSHSARPGQRSMMDSQIQSPFPAPTPTKNDTYVPIGMPGGHPSIHGPKNTPGMGNAPQAQAPHSHIGTPQPPTGQAPADPNAATMTSEGGAADEVPSGEALNAYTKSIAPPKEG